MFTNEIRNNPGKVVRKLFGIKFIWSKQLELLNAIVQGGVRISVRGANKVGKSYIIALAILLYFITRKNSKIIVTSPTEGQLKRGLWAYIRKAAIKIENTFGFEVQDEKIFFDKDSWWIQIATARKQEVFQGGHSKYFALIIDEGSGVPDWIEEVLEGLHPDLVVVSYNPLEPSGFAYKTLQDLTYLKMRFSALEHPNITSGKTVIPGAVTLKDVQRIEKKYGSEHPIYVARVKGDFPQNADFLVIPRNVVELFYQNKQDKSGHVIFGVDVARTGKDSTVVSVVQGNTLIKQVPWGKTDTMETTGRIIQLIKEYNPWKTIIDMTGIGAGVYDRLKEQGYRVIGVNFAQNAKEKDRFSNARAEMYWTLRDLILSGEIASEIKDEELASDLIQIEYTFDSKGRIKLKPKEDLPKSPDKGDSVALAFYRQVYVTGSVNVSLA